MVRLGLPEEGEGRGHRRRRSLVWASLSPSSKELADGEWKPVPVREERGRVRVFQHTEMRDGE